LSLEDLKTLPRESWSRTRVQTVMRPISPQFFVDPGTTLDSAQELMKENGIGSLAVINSQGKLVGFLQKGKVTRQRKSKSRPR
jgi:CBS domain-containing protein